MCYAKPGPRCSGHSLTRLAAAVAKADLSGTLSDRAAALIAEDVYDTTPKGQARLAAMAEDPACTQTQRIGLEARIAAAKARRKSQAAAYKEIVGKPARADSAGAGDQDDLPDAVPPAPPADPNVYEHTITFRDYDGAEQPYTRKFAKVNEDEGVHIDYFDNVRVQADRPLTEAESTRLAQLTGYAASATMGRGEGMGDPERDTDSSVILSADVTKYPGRRNVGEFPDRLREYVRDGSPLRKTDRSGPGTKGTRLVEGIPDIEITLWADSVWDSKAQRTA